MYIIAGVSLAFALLSFWPFGGLSVAGMPLTLYAFLNIRDGNLQYWNWLFIRGFQIHQLYHLSA